MKTINALLIFAISAAITPALSAKPLDCAILKQSIEEKLQAHGVKRYTLEVVDKGAAAEGKEVGSCNGGTRKIFYVNLAKRDAAMPGEKVLKAPRAAAGEDRVRNASTAKLIRMLRKSRNHELYYSWPDMPPNVKELARRPDDVAALISACAKKKQDELFRFNIMLILNHKLSVTADLEAGRQPNPDQGTEFHALKSAEKKAIADCLVGSLKDASAMVRTEAVWGLAFLADPTHEVSVLPLMQDSDANVVKEATTTIARIRGQAPSK